MAEVNATSRNWRFQDLSGRIFGRLTVISHAGKRGEKNCWLCRCECGVQKVIMGESLRSGRAESCGCLNLEMVVARSTTHGKTHTSEFHIWTGIIQRCTDPNSRAFADYGGRGITVCERWRNSFEAFLEDVGPRPTSGHTIERKDNALSYDKDNCEWATRVAQNNNTRRNVFITHNGVTRTIAQWARESGLKYAVLYRRLKAGMSIEEALTIASSANG